jgi:hypothetical protein
VCQKTLQFVTDFLRNPGLLLIIGIVLLVLFPDMMRQVFQLYGALFGPLVILMVVVAALPRRSRRRD